MTNEEKQILLKVLGAMLPYGLQVLYCAKEYQDVILTLKGVEEDSVSFGGQSTKCSGYPLYDRKGKQILFPFLRHMSSMTHSEYDEYLRIKTHGKPFEVIDWLNKNHFDYRGLIPMGLALEAPKDMYK